MSSRSISSRRMSGPPPGGRARPAERQAEAEAGKLGQDDAMSFGERLRRAAPPAGGAAEAVHQQDGWAVADGAEAHDTAADPHPRVVDCGRR